MEMILSNIFKATRVTNLSKFAVEFWDTFDIQIDMTLTKFWEKLRNYTF